MLYKVTIDAVDGESFYMAGGSAPAMLLAFLKQFDHEGSCVSLEWHETPLLGHPVNHTDDAERVYRILEGEAP